MQAIIVVIEDKDGEFCAGICLEQSRIPSADEKVTIVTHDENGMPIEVTGTLVEIL